MRTPRHNQGFTLIELLITVVLLGIFASIAIPGFSTLVSNSKIQSTSSELANLLQYARSIAAEKNTSIVVCESSGTWTVRPKGTSSSLCGQPELRSMLPSDLITIRTSANALPITFNSNGSTGSTSSFTVCKDTDAANGFKITVQASGNVRLWNKGKNESGATLPSCTL